jgi:hypothetical protein
LLPDPEHAPVAVAIPDVPALGLRVEPCGRGVPGLRATFLLGAAVANPWCTAKIVVPAA